MTIDTNLAKSLQFLKKHLEPSLSNSFVWYVPIELIFCVNFLKSKEIQTQIHQSLKYYL